MLTVQAIADGVERALAEINMEYKEKRASGRLAPLAASILGSGTSDAYKAMHLAAGQRDTQYKPVVLTYARDCRFPFAEHVAGEDAANGRVAGTGTL